MAALLSACKTTQEGRKPTLIPFSPEPIQEETVDLSSLDQKLADTTTSVDVAIIRYHEFNGEEVCIYPVGQWNANYDPGTKQGHYIRLDFRLHNKNILRRTSFSLRGNEHGESHPNSPEYAWARTTVHYSGTNLDAPLIFKIADYAGNVDEIEITLEDVLSHPQAQRMRTLPSNGGEYNPKSAVYPCPEKYPNGSTAVVVDAEIYRHKNDDPVCLYSEEDELAIISEDHQKDMFSARLTLLMEDLDGVQSVLIKPPVRDYWNSQQYKEFDTLPKEVVGMFTFEPFYSSQLWTNQLEVEIKDGQGNLTSLYVPLGHFISEPQYKTLNPQPVGDDKCLGY